MKPRSPSDGEVTREPDYLAQADNGGTLEAQRRWLEKRREEMRAEGITHARVSVCPSGTWPGLNLILVEGWVEKPDYQGEPRWQLTAEPQ